MKKILVSLAVALTVSAASYAQLPIQFGVQAGLNLSNLSGDVDKTTSKIGFNVGVTADYALSEALFLQPALLFTTKGCDYDINGAKATNISYLELPINVGYKIPLESFTVSLKAGPYLAYGLSGKNGDTDLFKDESITEPITGQTITVDAQAKRFDYGVGIGAGIEFGAIGVGLSYELGLADISNGNGSIKNQNAMLSVGYKF